MPNGRLLNRDDLDEAFPDHPVIGPSPQRKFEDEFSSALASVDAFHVEGDRLDLIKGSQVVAVFKSDQP